jgi:hypothetical protein
MPSHEQVEQFFMEFAREMSDQGHFLMNKYNFDWPNLPTEEQIRDSHVENQYFSEDSDNE